jgi:hypothetical protein
MLAVSLTSFAQDATQQPQLRLQQLLKVVTRGKELLISVLHVISDAKSTGQCLEVLLVSMICHGFIVDS